VAFESRKMTAAELNYPVHEKELLAIVHALRVWRHYLHGAPFKVVTDHASLRFLDTQPTLSRRQARWMELLQEYEFKIVYRPGKDNPVADALSRRPDLMAGPDPPSAAEPTPVQSTEHKTVQSTESLPTQSAEALPLTRSVARAKPPQGAHLQGGEERSSRSGLVDPIISLDDATPEERREVMRDFHDSAMAGHLGLDKCYSSLRQVYKWSGMYRDLREYIATCDACQRNKPRNMRPAGLLQPLPVPTRRWSDISMDLIVQLPPTRPHRFDAVLVVVDRLSKMAHFMPTRTDATAPELARLVFREVVRLHGIPRTIVSDRDSRFTSRFWRALHRLLDVRLAMSTAFHPQTDGQTERMNRTLEEMLRAYVGHRQDDW
jgi:transposase InsO family protein